MTSAQSMVRLQTSPCLKDAESYLTDRDIARAWGEKDRPGVVELGGMTSSDPNPLFLRYSSFFPALNNAVRQLLHRGTYVLSISLRWRTGAKPKIVAAPENHHVDAFPSVFSPIQVTG